MVYTYSRRIKKSSNHSGSPVKKYLAGQPWMWMVLKMPLANTQTKIYGSQARRTKSSGEKSE